MTPEFITMIGKETIWVVLMVAAPILASGMIIGLAISLFQAVTQIQEMTLTFVPKIVVVMVSLLFFAPWMMELLINYTTQMITSIPDFIR
ncbi:MAG: flagellar biosynthesis protein FliQ [Proteobacteria bacterium]|nr:flagellar biosynthesis protein FliQ [Pseudomonadota bacterium]